MGRPPLDIPGPLGVSRLRSWMAGIQRRAHPTLTMLGEVIPRLFDILVSGIMLIFLSPVLLVRALWSRYQTGRIVNGTTLVGRYQTPFRRLEFAGKGCCQNLIVWLNVFRGDMAIVGPRPLDTEEVARIPVEDLVRFAVRPGLISLFGVRSQTGLAHQTESEVDRELYYKQSVRGDLGLAARSIVSGALGGGNVLEMPPVLNFFSIPVVNTTMSEAVEWVIANAKGTQTRQMAFVNPDCLNIAWKNPDYRAVLRKADRVLPDGIGIHLGSRMMQQALKANVNGTDMFPLLCEAAAQERLPIYLLGAKPGIADAAAENMKQRYPDLNIAGCRDGYFAPEQEEQVVADVNESGARILLVAFGAPRQELWLERWKKQLEPSVTMGVGGLFDFYSGRIPRAPAWMREMGLEWAYRLMQEPGRMWRRYIIGNPLFLYRVRHQVKNPNKFPLPDSV